MNNNKISQIRKIDFKYNFLDNNSIFIPIKTFKNHICQNTTNNIIFIDFKNDIKDFNNKLTFDDNINSIFKISLKNKEYLFISQNSKNELYLIKDNNKIVKAQIDECFEKDIIQQLVVLDNNNIAAIVEHKNLSFYNYNKSKYQKFFKNINKNGKILGLCKLPNNKYCFLARDYDDSKDKQNLIFVKFHEDFTSVEKKIEKEPPNDIIKNNMLFKINNNKVIIIGKNEFIIFDVNNLEINTIFEVGLICGVLPFNNGVMTNNDDNFYNYMAVILYEKENFYLKIFSDLNDNIKEIDKINLVEYSSEFEALIDDNSIFEYFNININSKKEPIKQNINLHFYNYGLAKIYDNILYGNDYDSDDEIEIDIDKYKYNYKYNDNNNKYHNIGRNNTHINFYFDMTYDLKNNENIILIVNFIRSWGNKKLTILLDIDLKNLPYI